MRKLADFGEEKESVFPIEEISRGEEATARNYWGKWIVKLTKQVVHTFNDRKAVNRE